MCGTTTSTARRTSSSPTSPTCAARSTRPTPGCCTRSAGWATPCGCRVVPERAGDVTIATNAEERSAPAVARPDEAGSAGTIESGAPEPARPPRTPRVPLRITLVALMVVLVAVGLGATGLTATSLLKGYLRDQQDAQLAASVHQLQRDPPFILDAC